MNKEDFISKIEETILKSLDDTMNELVHGEKHPKSYMVGTTRIAPKNAGWVNSDLDNLLPAIRKHAEVLWDRFEKNGKMVKFN